MQSSLQEISPDFNYVHQEVDVLDFNMAYVNTGEVLNETIVFLHGNPTSPYLWRNIIPHVVTKARCIAPELIGMGRSGKPNIAYRFADHARHLSAFLNTLVPDRNVVLVVHDWGSALGLDWARRHQDRVSGIVLMEFITPLRWDVFPEQARAAFKAFRS
jgi:haloalkane dehalogenase